VTGLATTNQSVQGPAVLEDYTTTVLVPAGWKAAVDSQSNLILSKEA
jgi:N-methylhydantoinase A